MNKNSYHKTLQEKTRAIASYQTLKLSIFEIEIASKFDIEGLLTFYHVKEFSFPSIFSSVSRK